MGFLGLLHHHPRHRARQLRWVVPLAALLLVAVLATLAVQYQVSNREIGAEFFRAHKTISHTGELLRRGTVIASVALLVFVLAVMAWALRLTHRIVRPVHTLHRALDALVAGELGVRVELHRQDEFREVGEALNRLVEELATTLGKAHALVDRIAALTAAAAHGAYDQASEAQLRALVEELDQIPTTDLVPVGQVTLQLQNGNTEVSGRSSVFHQPQLVPQSEFGLPWNLEAGLDVAPSDPPHDYRPILNLKWSPVREDYRVPAVAVGATQLGVGFVPSYFLVLSKTLNYQQIQYQKFRAHHRNVKLRGIRLHAGMLRTSNAWRALAGTDVEVSDHFVVYADWISGARNSVSLGGVLVIDRQNSVQASLLRGNGQDRLSGLLVGITHTFDLAHPFEW